MLWTQVNLGVVKERLEAHPMTVFTESDVRYELGASFILPLTPRFQD